MRILKYLLIGLILISPIYSYAAVNQIEETDGSPSQFPWKLKFDNGTLTNNGDGTMTHSIAGFATGVYLRLIQPAGGETVTVDKPIFEEGVAIGDSNKYLKKIDSNTVGLYVNNVLVQDWEVIPATPGAGSAMGLFGYTYSS